MAQNIFGLGQQAFANSYDQQQAIRDQMTRRQAGGQLAGGDQQAAYGTLAQGGMLPEARQVMADQNAVEQQQYSRGLDERGMKLKLAEIRATRFKQLAEAAGQVPYDTPDAPAGAKRLQFIQQALPILQHQLELPPEEMAAFSKLTPDQVSNAGLSAFGAQIDNQLQMVNLGGGGVGTFNKQTGDFKTLREPTQKAPQGFTYGEDGGLVVDPGYVQGRAQISNVTRAPARGRSGGGRSGGKPKSYGAGDVQW